MRRRCLGLALIAVLLAAESPAQPAATRAPIGTAPALSPDTPLQCWWRASSGAIRVGEVVEVTLTCAVLESGAVRAVPDESRLSVASVQLAPFEIVGGTHPPDMRSGDWRFSQYTYRLRLIDADVIGRDVKLPPLAIPYRLHSQVGAEAALAGRDLTHLMPPLPVRVVSQVPAEAVDIRDGADASLTRIDALRFRANGFRVAALVLGALGVVAALGAFAPAVRRLRRGRTTVASGVPERVVLGHAADVLDRLAHDAAATGWTEDKLAEAHGAVRVTAAALLGGLRQRRLDPETPAPEGRLILSRRFPRRRTAMTAPLTSEAVGRAVAALPPDAPGHQRRRLEGVRDSLDAITRARYRQGTNLAESAPIDEAVAAARDIARDAARERLWSLRDRVRRAAPASPAPGV